MKRPNRSHPPNKARPPKRASPPAAIEPGSFKNAMIDALQADRLIEERKTGFLRRWAKRLRESWFVVGLEAVGLIGLTVAAVLFVYELRERQDERITRAWQLLTVPATGNSGKREALEFLNSQSLCLPYYWRLPWYGRCWKERISLTGIDLGRSKDKPGVYLRDIDLAEADLRGAILSGADLQHANLSAANLEGANLNEANLKSADFSRAYLRDADLFQAHLEQAILAHAVLTNSDLALSNCRGANFSKAKLINAKAVGASFHFANLSGAHLFHANLGAAEMFNTNLSGAMLWDTDFSMALFWSVNVSGANFRRSKGFEKSIINSIWAYEDTPPKNMPLETVEKVAYRKRTEGWSEFFQRTTTERPELGW